MKQLYRLFFSFVLVMMGLGIGAGETAVSAQTIQQKFSGANWVITVAVENGQPQFTWNVYIWLFGNIVAELQTPLNCTIDPSVVIHNDHLSFDGSGAIHCPIPSFADDVAQLTNIAVPLPPQVVAENIFMEADLTLPAPTGSNQNMSVFSHPDFRYDAFVYGQSSVGSSGAFPMGEQRIVGGATFTTTSRIAVSPALTTLGIFVQPDSSYLHLQDGLTLKSATIGDKFLIGTGTADVCIGCGPAGFFIGDLWYGEFDPGCTGICGVN